MPGSIRLTGRHNEKWCIADVLVPSEDKCSLREILESVDPSAELIISKP
jgi:hypothetical protein